MEKQKIVIKLDRVATIKAQSRESFRSAVPRPQRIDNRRKRQPKYKPNYSAETE